MTNPADDPELLAIRDRLLTGMREYMEPDPEEELDDDEEWDCGYTGEDVDRCATIVDAYLASLSVDGVRTEPEILESVKTTVLALNALNAECDGQLIETEQREKLCELILSAARKTGLQTGEDVTEPYREW